MISIEPLRPADREAWEKLARGYKAFYRTAMPDDGYDVTWRHLHEEGSGFYGLGARSGSGPGSGSGGELIGITHYLFHPVLWYGTACYLQDLYVSEDARGQGAGRAMIERVATLAKDSGATRLYWTTQEDNLRARVLYDKLARYNGFIKYDYPL